MSELLPGCSVVQVSWLGWGENPPKQSEDEPPRCFINPIILWANVPTSRRAPPAVGRHDVESCCLAAVIPHPGNIGYRQCGNPRTPNGLCGTHSGMRRDSGEVDWAGELARLAAT